MRYLRAALILAVLIFTLVTTINASILRLSTGSKPVELKVNSASMQVLSPFPSPKNVNIVLWPSEDQADSIKITWSPVPGAVSYRIYSAVAIPDSSLMVPHVIPFTMPDGTVKFEYRYDKHPIFGDPLTRRLHTDNAPLIMYSYGGPGSGTVAKFTPFTPVSGGRFEGCSFFYPLSGERDRFFMVSAVR